MQVLINIFAIIGLLSSIVWVVVAYYFIKGYKQTKGE